MKYGESNVITGNATILWNGITQPESKPDGTTSWSLKVAIPNSDPCIAELQALATAALQASTTFKGVFPPGGSWPLGQVDPNQFEGKLPAHTSINPKSRRGVPQVFDANGKELPPAVYGPMLYPGAIVRVLVHCFDFSNVQKGIGMGLDGIQIVNAQAPKLPVGGVDATAAFGSAGVPQGAVANFTWAPTMPPGVAAPPVTAAPSGAASLPPGVRPAPDFLNPGAPPTAPAPPPPAPPAPPAAAVPMMLPKAAGVTYEAFIAQGWTDAQLIAGGYMKDIGF